MRPSAPSRSAIDRGVDLRSDLPPRLRAAVGDRRRVEQILTNLAGNALKFTPVGGTIEIAGWFDGPGRARRGPRRRRRHRAPRTGPGSSSASTACPATPGSPAPASACRSPASSPGRWAATSDVASVPGSGSSFVLALPASAAVRADEVGTGLARAIAARRSGSRNGGPAGDPGRRRESAETDLASEPRPYPLPLPRILPPPDVPLVVSPRSAASHPPVRLRSIDGSANRDGSPNRDGSTSRDGRIGRPDTPSPA